MMPQEPPEPVPKQSMDYFKEQNKRKRQCLPPQYLVFREKKLKKMFASGRESSSRSFPAPLQFWKNPSFPMAKFHLFSPGAAAKTPGVSSPCTLPLETAHLPLALGTLRTRATPVTGG